MVNPNGITVTDLELNLSQALVNDPFSVDVYVTPTTAVGNQTNAAVWNLTSSGNGLVAAQDTPSTADVADFTLAPGDYGIALVLTGAGHRYTNGNGSNQNYSNADIELDAGSATNAPFLAPIFMPRVWNGTICYQTASECFLLTGLRQWNFLLGSDAILVEPILVIPMTLSTFPSIDVPNDNGLVGLSVYVQSFLYNPTVYANDPIKVSDGLDFRIGVSTTPYGPTNQIVMWPTGSIVAQPGGQISIGFAIP